MTTKLSARGADSKSNEEWKSRRHPEIFEDGMTRCAEETLDTVKEKEVIKCLKCEGLVKILAEEKKK